MNHSGGKKRLVRFVLGLAVSVLLLWFLFRETDWQELVKIFGEIDYRWLILAFVMEIASLFARVQRWSFVVQASQPTRFSSLFSATQIGMLVNCVIPARVGDIVRGGVLSRLEQIPFSKSITLVALDRINDVLALVLFLLVSVVVFPDEIDITIPPGSFGNSAALVVSSSVIGPFALGLTIALLTVMAVIVALYLWQDKVLHWVQSIFNPFGSKVKQWVVGIFENFTKGLHVFNSTKQLALAILFSLLTWGLVAASLACLMLAFDLNFPWFAPVVMLAVVGAFTSVTVTPGMVGQYHFPVIVSLLMVLPHTDINLARAIAILAHLVAFLPPVFLGVYCIVRDDLGLGELFPDKNNSSN